MKEPQVTFALVLFKDVSLHLLKSETLLSHTRRMSPAPDSQAWSVFNIRDSLEK